MLIPTAGFRYERISKSRTPKSLAAITITNGSQHVKFGKKPVFARAYLIVMLLVGKTKTRAGIEDATFLDACHVTITTLAKKLNVLDLARMFGYPDFKKFKSITMTRRAI